MAELHIGHQKSSLVFSTRLPIVKWRSGSVAESAYHTLTRLRQLMKNIINGLSWKAFFVTLLKVPVV